MSRLILAVLAFAMVIGVHAGAQAVPDFSGTWTLDVNKSDFGMPAGKTQMNKVVLVIKQSGNQLSVQRSTGDVAVYNLDGRESVNNLPSGATSKTVLSWAGDTLVGKSVSEFNGNETKMTDKRSLSADGKEMVLDITMQLPSGERKQRLVYTKQ